MRVCVSHNSNYIASIPVYTYVVGGITTVTVVVVVVVGGGGADRRGGISPRPVPFCPATADADVVQMMSAAAASETPLQLLVSR